MIIRDSDIELILQRINTSYAEAERALIKAKGDMNKALKYLSKKQNSFFRRTYDKIKDILLDIFRYKLIITRKDEILINLPIMLIIIFIMFFNNAGFGFSEFLLVLLLIILTDCKVVIQKSDSDKKVSRQQVTKPTTPSETKDDIIGTLEVIEEDDYNEILVEN